MARALYIHWPFCLKKCPYCDFNSHVRDGVDIDRWQAALLADMRHEAELAGGEALESVFFGGGTPSLMPPALVAALLAEAERLWGFAPGIEITLEANPSSVEASKFRDLATAGVNRVSLGLQALDDEALHFLDRLHDVREGIEALDVAQRAFERVSFDLIYARPGHTPEQWQRELARALAFGTGHLSLYQLTIEEGTRFATDVRQGAFVPLADDPAADLFAITRALTDAAGLPAYEVSNHARPGEESRHNLTYWRYGDYVGIGPGAHGRLTTSGARIATATERRPEAWLGLVEQQGHGMVDQEILDYQEQADELLLMGLRLKEGVDLARWQMLSGRDPDPDREQFLIDHGFVERLGNSRLRCTPAGMLILDAVVADLAC